jgi:hypothetical protein
MCIDGNSASLTPHKWFHHHKLKIPEASCRDLQFVVKVTQNMAYLNDVYLFRIVDQGEAKGRDHPQANSEAMSLSGALREYGRQDAYTFACLLQIPAGHSCDWYLTIVVDIREY